LTGRQFLFNTSRKTVVTYDDTYSLGDKAAFAKSNGMAGCFTWSLDQVSRASYVSRHSRSCRGRTTGTRFRMRCARPSASREVYMRAMMTITAIMCMSVVYRYPASFETAVFCVGLQGYALEGISRSPHSTSGKYTIRVFRQPLPAISAILHHGRLVRGPLVVVYASEQANHARQRLAVGRAAAPATAYARCVCCPRCRREHGRVSAHFVRAISRRFNAPPSGRSSASGHDEGSQR
jgi:hypothetical protein